MTEEFKEMQFVAIGIRVGRANKKLTGIQIVNEDGSLGREFMFEATRKNTKVIGQVYSGAKFSESQVIGLGAASWCRHWKEQSDLIKWAALEKEALNELAISKLEKDAKANNEIERLMRPLRLQYNKLYEAHDMHACRALSQAVIGELQRKPKMSER